MRAARTASSALDNQAGIALDRRPIAPVPTSYHCFAESNSTKPHLNAVGLMKKGVWLGDYKFEREIVTGSSYFEEKREYYRRTSRGSDKDLEKGLPTLGAKHHRHKVTMECAACGASHPNMMAEQCLFEHEDMSWRVSCANAQGHIVATANRSKIWIYPCWLGDRKVFAILRTETSRQQGHVFLRSFWKTQGFCTDTESVFVRNKLAHPSATSECVWESAQLLSLC